MGLSKPFTRQPPSLVGINWASSYAKGLVCAFNGAPFADGVTRQVFRGTAPRVQKNGKSAAQTTGTQSGRAINPLCNVVGEITVMSFIHPTSFAASGSIVSKNNTDGGVADPTALHMVMSCAAGVGYVGLGRSNAGGIRIWRSVRTLTVNTDQVVAYTQAADMSVAPRFYFNGAFDTGTPTEPFGGAGTGAATANTSSVKIGNGGDSTTPFAGFIYAAYVWARIVTEVEIAQLSANPWLLWAYTGRVSPQAAAVAGFHSRYYYDLQHQAAA